jgi:hypothetical protein
MASKKKSGRGRFVDLSKDFRETACARCGRPWTVRFDVVEPIVCEPPRDDCSAELASEKDQSPDDKDRGQLSKEAE